MNETIDLLQGVAQGGCSAKFDPSDLRKLLGHLTPIVDPRVLVATDTADDAGVYQLNDDTALVVTTDFFPPLCSDPYTFGRIAAANALSDVYAMGANPLLCLNLLMLPATEPLRHAAAPIIEGAQSVVAQAGAITLGGHTIEDSGIKFGLAVVGTIPPARLITNAGAQPGDLLLLTKPIGTGVILAAHRMGLTTEEVYAQTLEQMATLNRFAAQVMQQRGATSATDITGFGLVGHAMQLAQASGVSLTIDTGSLPILPGVRQLLSDGCIPGACFRNRKYTEGVVKYAPQLSAEQRLLLCDAQTSGGLLFSLPAAEAHEALKELQAEPATRHSAIIGSVEEAQSEALFFV